MAIRILTDGGGRVRARIQTTEWEKLLLSPDGKVIGRYNIHNDLTTRSNGTLFGKGDQLMFLLDEDY